MIPHRPQTVKFWKNKKREGCHAFVEMAGLHGDIPRFHPCQIEEEQLRHAESNTRIRELLSPLQQMWKTSWWLVWLAASFVCLFHSLSPSRGWLAGGSPNGIRAIDCLTSKIWFTFTELSPRFSLVVIIMALITSFLFVSFLFLLGLFLFSFLP